MENEYLLLKRIYDTSKIILEKEYENQNVFVASYVVYVTPDKNIISTCTWTFGLPTIFPKTDYISLVDVDTGELMSLIKQDDFMKLGGVKFKILCENPTYYFGESYPNIDTLKDVINHGFK